MNVLHAILIYCLIKDNVSKHAQKDFSKMILNALHALIARLVIDKLIIVRAALLHNIYILINACIIVL